MWWLSPIAVKITIFFPGALVNKNQLGWQFTIQRPNAMNQNTNTNESVIRSQYTMVTINQLDGWILIVWISDASENAYAAVIYSRIVSKYGTVITSLAVAKIKVTLIKPLTLSKLELYAAVLFVRSLNVVLFLYSQIQQRSLYWLLSLSKKGTILVSNRANKIVKTISINQWYCMSSELYSADCSSRLGYRI